MSVQAYIDQNESRYREELFNLLRIPSISTDSSKKEDIRKAAQFLKAQFDGMKPHRVDIFETPGHPIVYAEFMAGADKPTVLVYGHYDVQPPDPLNLWNTPPFEPTVIDGKVYARGSSDDKGQAYTHVKAIEAYVKTGTPLPANVKFILEGEEEIGSPNLVPFVEAHKDLLKCDMVLISDTAMFAKDVPSLTYGLRGLAYMEVEVTGPNRDLHSGVYGGAIDNPVNVLCQMIAALKDEKGRILIDGFYDDVRALTEKERAEYRALPFDEAACKKELGVDALFGEEGYSTLERASARPTVDVNGIWGGYTGEGAKTVLPSKANAKISMRLVPNQEPKKIAALFEKHFKKLAPPTVKVEVHEHHGGWPAITDLEFSGIKAAARAFEKVYGKKPLFAREGGSIPIVAQFKRILGADSILMGFGLNTDALHSPNEHFHLADYQRGIKVSAQFFEELT
jgi:acetylornithine deacetylase/succinyl-diaminopimelate desuccinylase-like protein